MAVVGLGRLFKSRTAAPNAGPYGNRDFSATRRWRERRGWAQDLSLKLWYEKFKSRGIRAVAVPIDLASARNTFDRKASIEALNAAADKDENLRPLPRAWNSLVFQKNGIFMREVPVPKFRRWWPRQCPHRPCLRRNDRSRPQRYWSQVWRRDPCHPRRYDYHRRSW